MKFVYEKTFEQCCSIISDALRSQQIYGKVKIQKNRRCKFIITRRKWGFVSTLEPSSRLLIQVSCIGEISESDKGTIIEVRFLYGMNPFRQLFPFAISVFIIFLLASYRYENVPVWIVLAVTSLYVLTVEMISVAASVLSELGTEDKSVLIHFFEEDFT